MPKSNYGPGSAPRKLSKSQPTDISRIATFDIILSRKGANSPPVESLSYGWQGSILYSSIEFFSTILRDVHSVHHQLYSSLPKLAPQYPTFHL